MSFYQCHECESIDLRVTRSGRDALGQPIRERTCNDCETRTTTVEVRVEGWTASQLSENTRLNARIRSRQKYGYKASTAGRAPISRWVSSSIQVISEGQESRGPAARALRAQGLTYQAIADQLGISKHTVYEHCHGRAKDGALAIPKQEKAPSVPSEQHADRALGVKASYHSSPERAA